MDPTMAYDVPLLGGEYVPFVYRYEHCNAALYRARGAPGYTPAGRDNAWSLNPDRSQTVEQIVYQGYFAKTPSSEPAWDIITDKTHTSWMGLDDVIGQIKGRLEIYQQNMDALELAKCSALNVFFEHERTNGLKASDRVYYSLNKNISRLYDRQMQERVSLWQDISKLRRDLPEAAMTYLATSRKQDLLKDNNGDGP